MMEFFMSQQRGKRIQMCSALPVVRTYRLHEQRANYENTFHDVEYLIKITRQSNRLPDREIW